MADPLVSDLPRLSLDDALASMDKLHGVLMDRAQALMDWYANARVGKRVWARGLRLASILLGCAATLVPMVASIAHALAQGERWANALLPASSIFGLLAGTCLLLDKFFGCSSSWMRLTMTHLELRARTEAFHLAWQAERLKLEAAAQPRGDGRDATGARDQAAPPPVADPRAPLLEALRAAHALHLQFLESINGVEKTETQEWVTEFKGTLADLERRMEEQRSAAVQALPGRGAVRVTLEGCAELVDGRFELQLGEGELMVYQGQSAVLPRVLAGIHTLQLKATRKGGTVVLLRELVRVEANQIAEVKLRVA